MLTPILAVEECIRLKGRVWDGSIIKPKDKVIITTFLPDNVWFHERGKLPDLR